MVGRRIIANYFTDEAREKAIEIIHNAEVTESFVFGDIEEEDIPLIEKENGLIVEILDYKRGAETPGIINGLLKTKHSFNSMPGTIHPRSTNIDEKNKNTYVIKLKGPLLDNWKRQLEEIEVKLISSIPYNSYTSRLTPIQAKKIKALPFVDNLFLYNDTDTRIIESSDAILPSAPETREERKMTKYFAILHDEDDMDNTLGFLKANNIYINSAKGRIISFNQYKDSNVLAKIKQLPEIEEVHEFIQSRLDNDISRSLLGIDSLASNDFKPNFSQEGENQIIGVVDSGIDLEHPDFKDRIVGAVGWSKPGDPSDYNGHGTHVAGSILGDGSASEGKIRGIAPKAKLFFQSVGGEEDTINVPYERLDEFINEAYNAGVRIYSCSWGVNTESAYYITSFLFDDYIQKHPDMLVIFSAGNNGLAISRLNGQSNDPINSKKGYVDWLSVGSPGSFKNGLTVGATRSSRTDGPSKDAVWGVSRKKDEFGVYSPYPDSPIADEKICGDIESMAAFSSRGPTEDRRIKPDVVAPGTDILSCRASKAPTKNFWGLYDMNGKYAYMGGTSMATPLVSGCAALIREYYIKERKHTPSAALLKATLINSTKWLQGKDSMADHDKLPNYHQGFGFVYMPLAIPNKTNSRLKLYFIDTWKYSDRGRKFTDFNQRKNYELRLSESPFLRICIAYLDRKGNGLQNNLNLFLLHRETGKVYSGNEQIRTDFKKPDPTNNVEVIRLENPPSGIYTLYVDSRNIFDVPLDFAVVVTGEGILSLVEIP